jgi:hypothetical protein
MEIAAIPSIKANPVSLREQEFKLRRWLHEPAQGIAFESMLSPDYWANIANKLTAGDHIEVRPLEGHYFADLYVRSVSKLSAIVAPIAYVEFDAIRKVRPTEEMEVRHRGRAKWSVMRGTDVLADGLDLREQAEAKMAELKAELQAA